MHQGVEVRVKAALARAEELEARLGLTELQHARQLSSLQQQQADVAGALSTAQQQVEALQGQLEAAQGQGEGVGAGNGWAAPQAEVERAGTLALTPETTWRPSFLTAPHASLLLLLPCCLLLFRLRT